MNFAEKLDFLMTLTKTSNSTLAQWSNIDPSYVSRLRRGDRTPASFESYTIAMAMYFAKNCSQDFQWNAIVEMMGGRDSSKSITDKEARKELIHAWLSDEKPVKGSMVRGFLDNMTFSQNTGFTGSAPKHSEAASTVLENASVATGKQGMRNSAIIFLEKVISSGRKHTLLLFSDQDTSWISEDPGFMRQWAEALTRVLMAGNRIKIIHTVSRNTDEMMTAIRSWVPLYMTGAIEPYYYPKLRDGLFKRTLYVAPGTIAVSSATMGSDLSDTTQFIVTDADSVASFEREFMRYLNICKPLMKIYRKSDTLTFKDDLLDFEDTDSSVRVEGPPALYTLPMGTIETLISSNKAFPKNDIMDFMKRRTARFEKHIEENEHLHQIVLPDIDMVRERKAEIVLSDYFCNDPQFYTADLLTAHIKNIIRYMRAFPNYHIRIIDQSENLGYILYAKEEKGVLVTKTSYPSVTFIMKESNLTAAFWDYLDRKSYPDWMTEESKSETIRALEDYIERLNEIK